MSLDQIIMVFVHVILMASIAAYPLMSKRNISFGIKMPLNAYNNDEVKKVRTQFMTSVIIIGIIMSIMSFVFNSETYVMLSVFTALAFYTLAYLYAYRKMKVIKRDENWVEEATSNTIIDTSFRKNQLTVPGSWHLIYLLIVIMTVLLAVSTYDTLPDIVNVQFNNLGDATSVMPKLKALSYLIGIQIFTLLLMVFVQYSIRQAKQELSNNNTKDSSKMSANFRYNISRLLFALGVVVGLAYMFAMMLTVGIITSVSLYLTLTLGSTLIVTVAIIVFSIKYGQDGNRMMKTEDDESNDFIDKEDDQHWKLGIFYFNRNDPSIFIGKRVGVGWSVNHARWQSWALYLGLIGFIVIMIAVSA